MPTLIIKSGTTAIAGATVKGSFSYFSGSTKDLGPTSSTGFYAGIDAPDNGYTVYQIGGPSGWNARVATDTSSLNSILISIGGTGSTVDQNITWATNTNSVFINSGTTVQPTPTPTNTQTPTPTNTQTRTPTQTPTPTNTQTRTPTQTPTPTNTVRFYYFGGFFTTFTGASQNSLIKLNTNGSKDTSFNIGSGFGGGVYSLAVQSDGKVLAGGEFSTFTGATQNRLIRLNTDGSKDTSFNIGSGFNNSVYSVAVQSDGKVLVGGFFIFFNGAFQYGLIRLNTDGSKDTSFNIGSGFEGT